MQWVLFLALVFHLLSSVTHAKGLISQCYSMLLNDFLEAQPTGLRQRWERDVGPISGDQWEEALQAVVTSSMISLQRLSQIYII